MVDVNPRQPASGPYVDYRAAALALRNNALQTIVETTSLAGSESQHEHGHSRAQLTRSPTMRSLADAHALVDEHSHTKPDPKPVATTPSGNAIRGQLMNLVQRSKADVESV